MYQPKDISLSGPLPPAPHRKALILTKNDEVFEMDVPSGHETKSEKNPWNINDRWFVMEDGDGLLFYPLVQDQWNINGFWNHM